MAPARTRIGSSAADSGQASVETVAVLPVALAVAAVCWQLALTGHAAWLSAHAARAGARADAVGANVGSAARSALPTGLERRLRVERLDGGGIRVEVRVPFLLNRWSSPITVGASSSLGGTNQ